MAESYEIDTILAEMLATVPDTIDKREGSLIYTTLAPAATLLAQQSYMLGYLFDLLFADTATGKWFDKVAYDFGIERERATYSMRRIDLFDKERAPLDIPTGNRFAINNLAFVLSEKIAVGQYKANCEQAGTIGNLYSGEILPVDNINGLGGATLAPVPLIPSRDDETDDEMRARFYRAVRRTPFGGNIADYENKTLEIEGVGAVKVFNATIVGGGNVGLVIGDEQGNKATSALVNKVQTLMGVNGNGLAPIWHTVSVKTSNDFVVNAAAQIKLRPGTNFSAVQPIVVGTIRKYLENIGFSDETIFYTKMVANILNCHESIMDVTNATMNSQKENIALKKTYLLFEVPIVGTITVTEAVT